MAYCLNSLAQHCITYIIIDLQIYFCRLEISQKLCTIDGSDALASRTKSNGLLESNSSRISVRFYTVVSSFILCYCSIVDQHYGDCGGQCNYVIKLMNWDELFNLLPSSTSAIALLVVVTNSIHTVQTIGHLQTVRFARIFFIPTVNLWNSLPLTVFPSSFVIEIFKRRVTKTLSCRQRIGNCFLSGSPRAPTPAVTIKNTQMCTTFITVQAESRFPYTTIHTDLPCFLQLDQYMYGFTVER